MRTPVLCALCRNHPAIRNSHAIPKFTTDWIKKTSATGYLRGVMQPNLRKQDQDTYELLCVNCEALFSKCEKKFAEQIFAPFQEERASRFKYESWLLEFAVSLAWRTSVVHLADCRDRVSPELAGLTDVAIEKWGDFLLKKSSDPGPYAHHMLFLSTIGDAEGVKVPQETHRYLQRSVDASIVEDEAVAYAYTKLPSIIFWTGICPPVVPGWHNTQIFDNGEIGLGQMVEQPGWGDFLVKQIEKSVGQLSQISDKQDAIIRRDVEKNFSRAQSSKTFEAVALDDYWDKRQGRQRPTRKSEGELP